MSSQKKNKRPLLAAAFQGPSEQEARLWDQPPPLSESDWVEICEASSLHLSDSVCASINKTLSKLRDFKDARFHELRDNSSKRRIGQFIKGVDKALGALGYLQEAGINSATEEPPPIFGLRHFEYSRPWLGLRTYAYFSDKFEQGTAQLALGNPETPLNSLKAIHALAFTAGQILDARKGDRGGLPASGDQAFVENYARILVDAGIDLTYGHDRSTEAMSGSAWQALLSIWKKTSNLFTVSEPASLAKYYRDACAKIRKEPAKKMGGSLP